MHIQIVSDSLTKISGQLRGPRPLSEVRRFSDLRERPLGLLWKGNQPLHRCQSPGSSRESCSPPPCTLSPSLGSRMRRLCPPPSTARRKSEEIETRRPGLLTLRPSRCKSRFCRFYTALHCRVAWSFISHIIASEPERGWMKQNQINIHHGNDRKIYAYLFQRPIKLGPLRNVGAPEVGS